MSVAVGGGVGVVVGFVSPCYFAGAFGGAFGFFDDTAIAGVDGAVSGTVVVPAFDAV